MSSAAKLTRFAELLHGIEQQIAAYYGFELQTHATEHLISLNELASEQRAALEATTNLDRAGILCDAGEGEMFVGIYFSDMLKKGLSELPEPHIWDVSHLDAFLVAIEELSHFHLIINRALNLRQVNILELECQAEVDKFIIGALNLYHHQDQAQLKHLFHLLFDNCSFHSDHSELYRTANGFAGRFVQRILQHGESRRQMLFDGEIIDLARKFYRLSWQDKHHLVLQQRTRYAA